MNKKNIEKWDIRYIEIGKITWRDINYIEREHFDNKDLYYIKKNKIKDDFKWKNDLCKL